MIPFTGGSRIGKTNLWCYEKNIVFTLGVERICFEGDTRMFFGIWAILVS